ncbi:GNAT family N-acetyltransferase [Afifella pfennigii]|uniref:GNAT family N-acetyltransferase n=1 Tax=Afifella pfennigii TaxID=209897 RepID=UPI0009FDC4E7|nr:GNAT family N-acetyltransferase [Afifella pfennigii]
MSAAEPQIRTERLVLVPTAPEHAAALHELKNDFEVVRMLANVPWPLSVDPGLPHQLPGLTHFAILAKEGPVGEITFKHPGSGAPPRAMPRLGYWIGRRFWGRGYATEALDAIVAAAFLEPGFAGKDFPERLGAGVFTDNPASRRVLEKLGFSRAGGYLLHAVPRHAEVEVDDMQMTRAAFLARHGAPEALV